jgi:endonuclease/exonuclease/phosphatase (EEP) superfamily protein YafD
MAPDFLRDRRFEPPPESSTTAANTSTTLRIFFANVAANNTEHQSLLDEIAAADPHVIVLAEFSWQWHMAMKDSPIMQLYNQAAQVSLARIGLVNVFSRLPVKSEALTFVRGRAMQTFEVELGGQPFRIVGLHAPRPLDDRKYDYDGYWGEMIPLLTSQPGPVVIVGDFNATEHSQVYAQLTADKLRSAHDDRGRGYATTWPNGEFWLPPIRIDQALVSADVECVRIAEGIGRGSDHKPLILDVRIRQPAGSLRSPAGN